MHWRKTGEFPAPATPKPATPAQPKPEEAAASTDSGAETPAAPAESREPGTQPDKGAKRNDASTRLTEILEDLRQAGLSPAQLKTFRAQQQTQQQQQQQAPPEKTENQPAAKPRPKLDDFQSWDEWQQALEGWRDEQLEQRVEARAKKLLEDFQQQQRQEAEARSIAERLSVATQKHGAGADQIIRTAASTLWSDQSVPEAVKSLLGSSPALMDVLYELGSQPEQFAAFVQTARNDPASAIRQAVLLEAKLGNGNAPQATVQVQQPRGDDGKFQKAPEKKPPNVPPPPTELGGQRGAPPDPEDEAFKANDFATFRAVRNRRDLGR